MNPDQFCNFDCVYCEVNRSRPAPHPALNVDEMAGELERTLEFLYHGGLRTLDAYRSLPEELAIPKHVALSGDGEPTLCPVFREAVQAVAHIRALARVPFFKTVLITNGSGLNQMQTLAGLDFLTSQDEIWIKLDAGTVEYYETINRPRVPLEKILGNIMRIGRARQVIIQSLFLSLDGDEPSSDEIGAYGVRLNQLQEAGTRIAKVQIYSATRPNFHKHCRHLSLKTLSRIAQQVREKTSLLIEVY